jgi:hypothetical protein
MVSSHTHPQNYLVCIDGSDASDLAFSVAMDGLYRPGVDRFNVATITNSKKDNLPFNFKPEYIEEKYMAKIYMIPNTGTASALFFKREVDHTKEGVTTKDTLMDLARELHTTVAVCGMHGRKGPKE